MHLERILLHKILHLLERSFACLADFKTLTNRQLGFPCSDSILKLLGNVYLLTRTGAFYVIRHHYPYATDVTKGNSCNTANAFQVTKPMELNIALWLRKDSYDLVKHGLLRALGAPTSSWWPLMPSVRLWALRSCLTLSFMPSALFPVSSKHNNMG